jgi:ubiquinone/menaquinone biosynthesis C-methylase UbiE
MNNITKPFYRALIRLLIIARPTVLFSRINDLGWYKNTLHEWTDNTGFVSRCDILELGCATGTLTAHLAQSGHVVTGIDASSKMIAAAKRKHSGISFLVANALDLPFESESFDACIAASLVNIVSDKQGAIDEMVSACKTGGLISVLVPSASFDDVQFVSLLEDMDVSGFSVAALEAWHRFAPKMETDEIRTLFMNSGARIVSVERYLQGMVVSVTGEKEGV